MTKKDLISFVKNSLATNKTSRYHENVIAYAIRMAYEQLLYDMYMMNPKNVDEYIVTLSDLVITNGDRDYVTLSKSFIKLPGKASGVRSVRATDAKFYPMTLQEYEQAEDLDIWNDGITSGYAVGQGKVYFHNLPVGWTHVSDTIDVDIVQSFEDYDKDDEVMIPNGQAERLMELVIGFLSQVPPKNLLNNNTDQNG
jgi:hypothetical protein